MDRGATGVEEIVGATGAAKEALDAVYSTLVSSSGQANSAVVSEMLRQVDLVAQSRRARLIASEGTVPNPLWLVLLGGAAITIGYSGAAWAQGKLSDTNGNSWSNAFAASRLRQ